MFGNDARRNREPSSRDSRYGESVRRLPNWRQGAPWWLVPFLLVGYVAAAVGVLVASLFDWWIFQILVLAMIGVGAALTGRWLFAGFCLVGAAAGVFGLRAEGRKNRSGASPDGP